MNTTLLYVTSGIYACVAINYCAQRRWGMGVAFLAYACANLGFVWDAYSTSVPK